MLKIDWDETRCRHAGVCVNSLPAVFKVEQGTLAIDGSQADEHQIRDVCASCPSGALTIAEG